MNLEFLMKSCSSKCIISAMRCESSETEISWNWKSCKREKRSSVMLAETREYFLSKYLSKFSSSLPCCPCSCRLHRQETRFRSAKQRTRGNFMRSALRTGTDLRPNPSSTSYSSRIRTTLLEGNAVNGKFCETMFLEVNQLTNSSRDEIT